MAAQSLVRRAFDAPRETYATNVMGTVNLLDAVRRHGPAACARSSYVTSDKCYENREWEWGYREDEPMGGHDPYSSSKGCAELVTSAYRRSFFSEPGAAARRLGARRQRDRRRRLGRGPAVPDIMRAALAGEAVRVRNPNSIRPWQHVLNPLSGYLVLAQALCESPDYATGWNFGPPDDDARPVGWIVERLAELWPGELRWDARRRTASARGALPQARLLARPRAGSAGARPWRSTTALAEHRRLVPGAARRRRHARRHARADRRVLVRRRLGMSATPVASAAPR